MYFKNPLLSSELKTSDKCCTSATSVLMRGQNVEDTQKQFSNTSFQRREAREKTLEMHAEI